MYKNFLKEYKKPLAILVVILFAGLLYLFPEKENTIAMPQQDDTVSVTFVDVGQGDAALIRSANGHYLLIDTGTGDDDKNVADYLHAKDVTTLDAVVITHPHDDHYGGFSDVAQVCKIKRLALQREELSLPEYEKLINIGKSYSADMALLPLSAADSFSLDGITFDVLSPDKADFDDANESSLVIKMTYCNISFLFTGDAETGAEKRMLSNGFDVSADVLKVAHHGSSSSTSDAFLQAVHPSVAVISVGVDNPYGHPHKETVDKLTNADIPVYRTDINGTVIFQTDGRTLKVHTDK